MILVTGSEGLIGRHVSRALAASGHAVRAFDLARSATEDVRNPAALARALEGVTGVLHLAAVSRVVDAEQDPETCQATNVDAFGELLRLCMDRRARPWVIFVSSREVYGAQAFLPVAEDAVLRPMNVYARSKVRGEALTGEAVAAGLNANICRLSNVFGCPEDHADRVAMAFAGAAAWGGVARVDGSDCMFDFTVIADVADGLCRLVEATKAGERLPPVHFVTGRSTTLAELASMAQGLSTRTVDIVEAPARTYDVSRFVGDPTRAQALLGWRARTSVEAGMAGLVQALQTHQPAALAPQL
jgi:nucleoside-diphosphate-sugar epimerase